MWLSVGRSVGCSICRIYGRVIMKSYFTTYGNYDLPPRSRVRMRAGLFVTRARVCMPCMCNTHLVWRAVARTRITLFAGHVGDCTAICRACVRGIILARPCLITTQIVASSNNYSMPVGASRAGLIASPTRKRRKIAKRSPETKRVMRDAS